MTLIVFGASDPDEPTDYAMLNLNWYISPPEGTTGEFEQAKDKASVLFFPFIIFI